MKNCLQVNDLATAVAPVMYIFKILGLAPYSMVVGRGPDGRRRRRLTVSRPAQVYGALVLLGLVVGMALIHRALKNGGTCLAQSLSSFLDIMASLTNYVLGLVAVIILNTIQPKEMVKVISLFDDVHNALFKSNGNSYRAILIITILEIVVFTVGVMITMTWYLSQIANSKDMLTIFLETIIYISAVIPRCAVIHCCKLTFLLYYYLKTMNKSQSLMPDAVRKAVGKFEKNSSRIYDSAIVSLSNKTERIGGQSDRSDCGPCALKDVRKVQFKLSVIMEKLSLMFYILVTLETISCVLNTSTIIFTYILTVQKNRMNDVPVEESKMSFWIFVWCLTPHVWRITALSLAGELASAQARRTVTLVQRALLWAQNEEGSLLRERELERFAAQLAASSMELRAAGGLRIDLGLLGAAAGATVSYLIVMLQFNQGQNAAATNVSASSLLLGV